MSINYRGGLRIRADLEEKLDAYRRAVKAQTGRLPTRETAANDLLAKALENVEPSEVPTYGDLVARVNRLESVVFRDAKGGK
jgi:hypothetical protein